MDNGARGTNSEKLWPSGLFCPERVQLWNARVKIVRTEKDRPFNQALENFAFQFVVSRCSQEENRHLQSLKENVIIAEAAALVAGGRKSSCDCIH